MFELKRQPVTPGEILLEEFLKPYGLSQTQLALKLECDIKTVNRIVKGRQAVSAGMALKLGGFFRTTPEFWLNIQRDVDLYEARKNVVRLPTPVKKQKGQVDSENTLAVTKVSGRRGRGLTAR